MRPTAATFTFLALVPALAGLAGLGCKSKKDAASVKLSESYTVATKLAVVHYPPDFAPSQASDLVAALTPLPTSAYDEAVELHFGTNVRPSTSVVDEYAHILHKNLQEGHADWKEEARAQVTCFKAFSGVEIVATFTGKKGKKLRYRSCSFFASGHGFWFAYMAPEKTFAEDEPLLRKVVDATEVRP